MTCPIMTCSVRCSMNVPTCTHHTLVNKAVLIKSPHGAVLHSYTIISTSDDTSWSVTLNCSLLRLQ